MSFLGDYEPKVQEDTSADFKPIKGAYVCRIADLGRIQGTSEKTGADYDFYALNAQVTDIVEGEGGVNRYLKMTFNDAKKLADVLYTAGLEYGTETQDEFDESLANLVDKSIKIRAWASPKMTKDDDGEWVAAEPRLDVQRLKVVAEFKTKAKKEETAPFGG